MAKAPFHNPFGAFRRKADYTYDKIRKTAAALIASAVIAGALGGCGKENEPGTGNSDFSDTVSSVTVSDTVLSVPESTVSSVEISEPVTSSENTSSEAVSKPVGSTVGEPAVSEPAGVTDPSESDVPAQHDPIVISSSSSKPAESKPAQSKPSESVPGGAGLTGGDWQSSSSSKPASSSKPVSSSTLASSSTSPSSSKPAQLTPTDTKGVALDANGCPADGKAWIKSGGSSNFVDSTGQLWNYTPTGWKKAGGGGVIDDSGFRGSHYGDGQIGH